MKQLDLFYESDFPIQPVGFGTSHSEYGAVPPKIYESPDGGKTVYARNFGETERHLIKSSVEQQWKITFNGDSV